MDEDREADRALLAMIPQLRELQARIEETPEKLRREYGVYINYVSPVQWQGRKVWAIGSRIYPDRPPDETFHEFLIHVLRKTLGEPWRAEQAALPESQQHFVFKCSLEWAKFKAANADPEVLALDFGGE